jgi:hypothetical protein
MDRDDPECPLDLTDRDWIDALWRTVIERDLGLPETDRQIRDGMNWQRSPGLRSRPRTYSTWCGD